MALGLPNIFHKICIPQSRCKSLHCGIFTCTNTSIKNIPVLFCIIYDLLFCILWHYLRALHCFAISVAIINAIIHVVIYATATASIIHNNILYNMYNYSRYLNILFVILSVLCCELISKECTKMSLSYSKPPLPSKEVYTLKLCYNL